jgi:hypothetical protein
MQTAYRIALACGAVPLVVGIIFYLFWLITRLEVLSNAAPVVILMSILLVLLGCVALARFAWQALRTPQLPRDRVWKAILIAGALLSANLPVTAGLLGQILPQKADKEAAAPQ